MNSTPLWSLLARSGFGLPSLKLRQLELLCLGLLSPLLGACEGPAPKRVQVELTPLVLSTAPVKALVWAWDDSNQKDVAKGKVQFQVTPPELASVTADGQLTCQSSGDGKVQASLQGVAADAPLKCRLVDHLEAPVSLGRIELSAGAVALDIAAFSKQGERLSDVPLTFRTRNAQVVRSEGTKLVPLSVGEAKVTVSAGSVEREFALSVVRQLKPEALPMNNGQRINFSLEPGRYELTVKLQSPKKLNAEWRGAPYCNYTGVADEHKSVCVLRASGGVVFDNPAYLDSGATTVSHDGVTIFEVP
ncbi:MAG TPA: hypothetical protein VHM70_03945 [Polyangiaceae bacterium]|jgi:hypothetical protein|nr:hypothetical protein [Polyangiaceae bacterium]